MAGKKDNVVLALEELVSVWEDVETAYLQAGNRLWDTAPYKRAKPILARLGFKPNKILSMLESGLTPGEFAQQAVGGLEEIARLERQAVVERSRRESEKHRAEIEKRRVVEAQAESGRRELHEAVERETARKVKIDAARARLEASRNWGKSLHSGLRKLSAIEKGILLEKKRKQMAAEKNIAFNSMVLSERDERALINLSYAAIDERIKAGILRKKDELVEKHNALVFWKRIGEMCKAMISDGKSPEIQNLAIIREGGEFGMPVGYLKFGVSKTSQGHMVLDLMDAFVEPDYRQSQGKGTKGGKYSLLGVVPKVVFNAIKQLKHGGNEVPVMYLTYDSKFRPGNARRQSELNIVPPIFFPNEPKPFGTKRVNAIQLKPEDQIYATNLVPFAAGQTQHPTGLSRAKRRQLKIK